MAKRCIYDCDNCDKKDVRIYTLSVFKERYTDAAGSRSDDYDEIDLCIDCCGSLLNHLDKHANKQVRSFLKLS